MKTKIHPQWYPEAQIVCACGNMFTTGSTKQTIHVEICHKCHPFFTGEMKYVDTLGRVEKFQKKQQVAKASVHILEKKKQKKRERKETEDKTPKTLREMLMGTS
jgi:large subunit ribosomal protein L31